MGYRRPPSAAATFLTAPSCNLGAMLANGDGVPEDDAEAVLWYRMATEQGEAWVQYNLGWMLSRGDGVP